MAPTFARPERSSASHSVRVRGGRLRDTAKAADRSGRANGAKEKPKIFPELKIIVDRQDAAIMIRDPNAANRKVGAGGTSILEN